MSDKMREQKQQSKRTETQLRGSNRGASTGGGPGGQDGPPPEKAAKRKKGKIRNIIAAAAVAAFIIGGWLIGGTPPKDAEQTMSVAAVSSFQELRSELDRMAPPPEERERVEREAQKYAPEMQAEQVELLLFASLPCPSSTCSGFNEQYQVSTQLGTKSFAFKDGYGVYTVPIKHGAKTFQFKAVRDNSIKRMRGEWFTQIGNVPWDLNAGDSKPVTFR